MTELTPELIKLKINRISEELSEIFNDSAWVELLESAKYQKSLETSFAYVLYQAMILKNLINENELNRYCVRIPISGYLSVVIDAGDVSQDVIIKKAIEIATIEDLELWKMDEKNAFVIREDDLE